MPGASVRASQGKGPAPSTLEAAPEGLTYVQVACRGAERIEWANRRATLTSTSRGGGRLAACPAAPSA